MKGLRGPLSCLTEARFGIIFGSIGAARDCLEATLRYAEEREIFDKPLGGFQLTQAKLADMTVELGKSMLLALHLGRLKDDGRITAEQVSFGKLNNIREAIKIARECRTIMGAAGITLEWPMMRHANNLESVLTYEGTTRGAPAGARQGAHRPGRLPLSRAVGVDVTAPTSRWMRTIRSRVPYVWSHKDRPVSPRS